MTIAECSYPREPCQQTRGSATWSSWWPRRSSRAAPARAGRPLPGRRLASPGRNRRSPGGPSPRAGRCRCGSARPTAVVDLVPEDPGEVSEVEVEVEAEAKAEVDLEVAALVEMNHEAQPEAEPEPVAEAPKPKTKAKPQAKPKAMPKAKPKAKAKGRK